MVALLSLVACDSERGGAEASPPAAQPVSTSASASTSKAEKPAVLWFVGTWLGESEVPSFVDPASAVRQEGAKNSVGENSDKQAPVARSQFSIQLRVDEKGVISGESRVNGKEADVRGVVDEGVFRVKLGGDEIQGTLIAAKAKPEPQGPDLEGTVRFSKREQSGSKTETATFQGSIGLREKK